MVLINMILPPDGRHVPPLRTSKKADPMTRILKLTGVIAVCFLLAGCGNKADTLAKKSIDLMNELAAAFETGDKEKIKSISARMKEVLKEVKDLKLTPEDDKKMEEKYKKEMEQAQTRMKAAVETAMKSGKFNVEDMVEISEAMKGVK
jgi:tellurite resistance protein